jgi:Leucine-rich repeat (LRR) protein
MAYEGIFTDVNKALHEPQLVLNLMVQASQYQLFLGHAKKFIHLETLQLPRLKLKELPIEIGYFQKLKVLIVNQNELENLPLSLSLLPELRRINLDNNKLKILPECLLKIEKLEHLSIDANLFSSDEKERIKEILPVWF